MAAGTYAYPGASNTYVKNPEATGYMKVAFSRNPEDFPLAEYAQYREVSKDQGLYLQIRTEQAARLVGKSLREYVWPDGADRPRRNNGTSDFRFLDYRTERYDFDFTLGYKAEKQADWNIKDTESNLHAQQAMTARTVAIGNLLSTTANWDASHVSDVAAIAGNSGSWEISTSGRQDIKRSVNYAVKLIHQHTLGVVKKKKDLRLVMNPNTAQKIGESQEIVEYLKSSPAAKQQLGVDDEHFDVYDDYGMPKRLYGIKVVIEDTVVVTSARGAASTTYDYPMADGDVFLLSRPGGLVTNAAAGPTFSTCMVFLYEEMTVETLDDPNNRRIEGHIVDDFAGALTAPVSGFYFQGTIE
jgi:hypothetical protein